MANIGAAELSVMAGALEAAGKQENVVFIESNTELFITALEALLARIDNALSSQRKNADESTTTNVELFKGELEKLKTALADMDGAAISRAVDILQKMTLSDENGTAVRSILKNIMLVEYDTAIEQTDVLLLKL